MILRLPCTLLLLLIVSFHSRKLLACSNGGGLVSKKETMPPIRFRTDNDITGCFFCDTIIAVSMLIGLFCFLFYVILHSPPSK